MWPENPKSLPTASSHDYIIIIIFLWKQMEMIHGVPDVVRDQYNLAAVYDIDGESLFSENDRYFRCTAPIKVKLEGGKNKSEDENIK